MSSFVNPFKPRSGPSYADALQRIRTWTMEVLPPGDPVISITELACAEPGCPPRETVILVMWPNGSAWKLSVHKAMPDIEEKDVALAMRSLEQSGPMHRDA